MSVSHLAMGQQQNLLNQSRGVGFNGQPLKPRGFMLDLRIIVSGSDTRVEALACWV